MLSDQQRLTAAICFAAHKHRDQRRKDVTAAPYINHSLALLSYLSLEIEINDVYVLMAAVLHDTVEDTKTKLGEIEVQFGTEVMLIVREVTDDKRLPAEQRKILQIEKAAESSYDAALVKIADKTCNLRDMALSHPIGWSVQRVQEYFDWSREVVTRLPTYRHRMKHLFDEALSKRP